MDLTLATFYAVLIGLAVLYIVLITIKQCGRVIEKKPMAILDLCWIVSSVSVLVITIWLAVAVVKEAESQKRDARDTIRRLLDRIEIAHEAELCHERTTD